MGHRTLVPHNQWAIFQHFGHLCAFLNLTDRCFMLWKVQWQLECRMSCAATCKKRRRNSGRCKAIFLCDRTVASSRFSTNVLPVPPGKLCVPLCVPFDLWHDRQQCRKQLSGLGSTTGSDPGQWLLVAVERSLSREPSLCWQDDGRFGLETVIHTWSVFSRSSDWPCPQDESEHR